MNRYERFRFRTGGDLRTKAGELGIDLPYSEKTGSLFLPLDVSGRRLSNRLVIHPMEGADADPVGGPGELTFRRYERFGRGGAALIWFEAAAVVSKGRSNPRQLMLTPKTLDAFKRLVERTRGAAKSAGLPAPDPLLILQLTHSGRFSKPEGKPAPVIARHDPDLDPLLGLSADSPPIADAELERHRDAYAAAAVLASKAGFDGIDIKACHGYLTAELLSARGRDGRYGGGYENRTRYLRETVREVRKAAPGLLAAVRLNVWDGLPYPFGFGSDPDDPERIRFAEPLRLAADLIRDGVTLLNLTAGIPHFRPHIGRPYDHPIRGGGYPREHPLDGIIRLIRSAGAIQTGFPSLPIVGTGYSWLRHLFPNVAAAVVSSGQATLIGVGRMAFAYPDFARDLALEDRINPRKTCVACSGCSTLARTGRPAGCVVRDAAFYRL